MVSSYSEAVTMGRGEGRWVTIRTGNRQRAQESLAAIPIDNGNAAVDTDEQGERSWDEQPWSGVRGQG